MRQLKLSSIETPNNHRYVCVFFEKDGIIGDYECCGFFNNGLWTSKKHGKFTNETPYKWCEVDWDDIIFSGFYEESDPRKRGYECEVVE